MILGMNSQQFEQELPDDITQLKRFATELMVTHTIFQERCKVSGGLFNVDREY
jgi:hypothetical protein